jgi:hypothetical protein
LSPYILTFVLAYFLSPESQEREELSDRMNPGEIGCRISRGRQDNQDIFWARKSLTFDKFKFIFKIT